MDTSFITHILLIFFLWILSVLVVLSIFYASDLKKMFQEAMLKHPVIIFESDDWGAGPLTQSEALEEISQLFYRYSDSRGQHPVMTLGIIMAEPDLDKIKESRAFNGSEGKKYFKRTIAHKQYTKLLNVIKHGVKEGVFSVQLHGMEHYWPESIMRSINKQAVVKRWFFDNTDKKTEDLPAELQSRWIDCSSLPSSHHSREDIKQAVDEEVSLYKNLFTLAPAIIVPPTFVWTEAVEQAYSKHNIQAIVTPGRQCVGRDHQGTLIEDKKNFFNGQENQYNFLYLIRNDYFEPTLGHKAERILDSIVQKTQCGRPTLLEMHRFNFINGKNEKIASLKELNTLLQLISSHWTDVNYMSTEVLAKHFKAYNQGEISDLIAVSQIQRLKIVIARIKLFFQYNRFAKYSGINLLLKLI